MAYSRFVLFLIFGFLICVKSYADSKPVVLDFPTGRFQDDKSPVFFRWTLYANADSLTLKVFRRNRDGSYDKTKNLVARFDISAQVPSMAWPYPPLIVGNYVWSIEGYDEVTPKPLFYEEAHFLIESASAISLRTKRLGIQVGFGRGQYTSVNQTYELDFKTTPTIYGILYRGGSVDGIWDLSANASDFILRGALMQTFSAYASYAYRLTDPNTNKMEIFIGPSLRTYTFPRVFSPNGVSIERDTISQLNPGLVFSTQKLLNTKFTLYSHLRADAPAYSSEKMTEAVGPTAYSATGGLIFGYFWPLAFGAEFEYRNDRSLTKLRNDKLDVMLESWALISHLVYTF